MLQIATAGVTALAQVYGFSDASSFLASHVETLKGLDNVLLSRCGHVLEAVQIGFGAGSKHGLMLIGVGRALLGAGVLPVGGTVALASPVMMTCAAIGAVHYGWHALSEDERNKLLDTVADAFSMGKQLVKAVADFAVETIKALLSSENLAELKRMVADAATTFGRRLGDITRSITDRALDVRNIAAGHASSVMSAIPKRLPFQRPAEPS
ncbi:hypothetical protein [Sphingomonas sp. Marseille-Q8236]|jgi:hypothetical protein